jgi:hypothetical protein
MTYPTFNSGDVLTAAEMNAVGLWLVKTQAVGNAVSSVAVTGAFTSDYANYFVTLSGGTGSASSNIGLFLTGSSTNYHGYLNYGTSTSATVQGSNVNNGVSFVFVGGATAGQAAHVSCQLLGPNVAAYTKCVAGAYQNGDAFGSFAGEHRVATAYTGFTILPGSGTLTGGTIRVYGYRN